MAGDSRKGQEVQMPGNRIGFAALVLGVALLVTATAANARTLTGTKRANTLVGTGGSDRIKGKAGNDKLKGKGGNDKLSGGKGRDRVVGGSGVDRLSGGPGNDILRAADGVADRSVNGGSGSNTCIVDVPLDLSVTRNCASIQSATAAGGGGGGNGAATLRVLNAQGLACLPLVGCSFLIAGDGADALVGSVTGGGSVTSVLSTAVGATNGTWTATGTYTCSISGGPGFLVVTIGSKSTPPIPVSCG
jgi:Ca2+-binding RTX toxin-like protein